jgi:hypothetical protein
MCVRNSPCRSLLFPQQRRQKNLIAFDGAKLTWENVVQSPATAPEKLVDGAVMNSARELVGV